MHHLPPNPSTFHAVNLRSPIGALVRGKRRKKKREKQTTKKNEERERCQVKKGEGK